MRLLPLLALLAVVVAVGCGSDGGDAASPAPAAEPTTTPERSERCVAATTDLMTPLGNGMRELEHRVKNGYAVESAEGDGVYFVSAEVYGEGVEEGTVGTWATTSLGGGEAIWTVDDVSKQYSDLRDGGEVAGVSMADDGAEESRACVTG